MEVLLEMLLERLHDAEELVAREIGGAVEAGEVLFELGQAGEEGLCGSEIALGGGWVAAKFRPKEKALTMFLVRLLKDGLVVQQLLDLGEERGLLVVVVRFDELEPGETVSDKVGFVLVLDNRGLVVNGVVTAQNRVV